MTTEIQKRGCITTRIKKKSLELMKYEINQAELRFMAYLFYVMMNDQHIELPRIDIAELEMIVKWTEMKYIGKYSKGITITKEFWNILSEICYLGYVDIDK